MKCQEMNEMFYLISKWFNKLTKCQEMKEMFYFQSAVRLMMVPPTMQQFTQRLKHHASSRIPVSKRRPWIIMWLRSSFLAPIQTDRVIVVIGSNDAIDPNSKTLVKCYKIWAICCKIWAVCYKRWAKCWRYAKFKG